MREKEKVLTKEQKKLDTDLWIIVIITMLAFGLYSVIGADLMRFCKDSGRSVWPRLFAAAAMEYAIAGLSITIVCVWRRESFQSFGLNSNKFGITVLATGICFLPLLFCQRCSGRFDGYQPLSIMVTEDLHKAGCFSTILGTFLIGIVWGFFEAFNYVVISEKIGRRYPVTGAFFDWGALVCGIVCVLFHPMEFTLWGIAEIVTSFLAIYGMLLVQKNTKNSWGCILAFLLIWNAI